MSRRLTAAAKPADSRGPRIKPALLGAGACLPSSENKKQDRGLANIINCDPEDVQTCKNWHTCNVKNYDQFVLKMSRGHIRNTCSQLSGTSDDNL